MWRQSAPTFNTWLLGPTCICLTTNGIWIGSSVSAGLTVATDEHRQKTGRQDVCRKSLRRCGLVIINGNLSLEVAPTPATFSRSSIVSVLFCSDSVPIRACFQPLVFLTSLSREHIGNWHVTEVQNFAMTFLKSEKRAKAEMTCVESNAITRQFRH